MGLHKLFRHSLLSGATQLHIYVTERPKFDSKALFVIMKQGKKNSKFNNSYCIIDKAKYSKIPAATFITFNM